MRERRPGVWEVRVVAANDLVTGQSVQRSFTVHGGAEFAEIRRRELVERFGVDRSALYCAGARLTVGDLLDQWAAADHQWRPATHSSSPSVVRFLCGDRIGRVGLAVLSPQDVEAAFTRWRAAAPPASPTPRCTGYAHSVGTHLVGQGKILKAEARLGHRDPATTLRHYAHALPLDDQDIADEIDTLLNRPPPPMMTG